jgi:hypothetical protein
MSPKSSTWHKIHELFADFFSIMLVRGSGSEMEEADDRSKATD